MNRMAGRIDRAAWAGSAILAAGLGGASVAMAHPGHGEHWLSGQDAWTAGLLHPLLGLDHLLAMVVSGLLAVRIGSRLALWSVPVSFAALMCLGGAVAAFGISIPVAEGGIFLSVVVLGLAVALPRSVPALAGAALVGLFALFHGYAHVAEIGGYALLPYIAGFVMATLALHAAAIGLGLLIVRSPQPRLVQAAGGLIAAGFVLAVTFG